MVKVVFGWRIVWGESVTEDEHQVGLAAYEAALEDGLRGLYPDAWISVQGEGHDSAARVTVDGEDVSETPRVVRVLEEAFSTGCDAIIDARRRPSGVRGGVSREYMVRCGGELPDGTPCFRWEQEGTARTKAEAERDFRRAGWSQTKAHGWLCPRCTKARRSRGRS